MKVAILLAICACAAAMPNKYGYAAPSLKLDYGYAAPAEVKLVELKSSKIIPILRQELLDDNKGTYKSEVHTGDGQTLSESGHLKDLGNKELDVVKEGSYSYTSPEGKVITVNWKSDENGFQAFGEHLPTAPPMPEEIRKSLLIPRIPEYNKEFRVIETVPVAYNHGYGYARH